jgi:predicted nucleic acid-binding protein
MMGSATGELLRDRLPDRADWLVPTMVQLELAKWLTREIGESAANRALAWTQLCQIAPLDTKIAVLAAELFVQQRLPTADAVIYATAQVFNADLLTCDAHFEGLAGVTYIAKTD